MGFRQRLRRSLPVGLVVGLVAALAAHAYRGIYLLAGGSPFPEIGVVSTTLAAFVPALLGSVLYGELAARTRHARAVFSAGAFAFALLSTIPTFVAPLHPGFAGLAAPLHVLVGGIIAFGVPWRAARAPVSPRAEGSRPTTR